MDEFDQLFKAIRITESELQTKIREVGEIHTFPKNTTLIEQGKYIKSLVLVISGRVRVWQEYEDREIMLYYVSPVETCVLMLSATFNDCKSAVFGRTEEETTVVTIPVRFATEWGFVYKSWHRFTTNSFICGYNDLLGSYRDLAFKKINERLIKYIEDESEKNDSPFVSLSHSQLAKELGTTREVISKILKQFEFDGQIKLHFKKVELLK